MKNILTSEEFIHGSYGEYGEIGLMVDIRQVRCVIGSGKGFDATYELIDIPEPELPFEVHVSTDGKLSITIAFGGIMSVNYQDVDTQTNLAFSMEHSDDGNIYREQGKEISSSLWWAKYGKQFVSYISPYHDAIANLFGESFYQSIVHPQ